MEVDPLYYPYTSQRMVVHAKKGMVATSQPLAAQAGLRVMQKGGNAIDAAIATAATLTVVEPNSNSIGGDSFALVWTKGKLHGLNGSGPAPQSMTIDEVKKRGHERIPNQGVVPITVPGTPGTWAALSKRFGKLPLTEVLKPAIEYAYNGFPVSAEIGRFWNIRFHEFQKAFKGPEFEEWFKIFSPAGRAPKIGEMWRSPDHARTLQLIAETQSEAFYRGELAEEIGDFVGKYQGFLTKGDLAAFHPEWVEPIKVNYRGYDVWQIPPNGQGIVALMALNILKGHDFATKDSIDTYHQQHRSGKIGIC